MKFNEYAGSIDIDTSHMVNFITNWYKEDDLVTIAGFNASGRHNVLSFTIPVKELVKATPEEFQKLTVVETDDRKMNVYISANPTKEDNSVTLYSKGGNADVREIYGCFIDLDINKNDGSKTGVFNSKEDIYKFLDEMPAPPSIIVDNGAMGGVHAYWRLEDEDTSKATKSLIVQWWSYINSLTDAKIDKLIDISRLSRLPSGIYWPSSGGKFDTVSVVKFDGPRYSLDKLTELSKDAFEEHTNKIYGLRMQKTAVDTEKWNDWLLDKVIKSNPRASRSFSERQVLILMHMIENYINTNISWEEILEPHGWTFMRTFGDSDEWARPGRDAKSATVNYSKEDGSVSQAMSLLSSSEETRLADLKEAGIPLSKRQVLLRLKYNDDIIAMINDLYVKVMPDG